MKLRVSGIAIAVLSLALATAAAQQSSNSAATSTQTVPPLIQFSNVATDEGGNTLSGVVSITFTLYNSQLGGEPLWTETQNNVQLDPTGHYSVELGITKPGGVPTTLFTTGEARWLGIQIAEQAPQARVLLLSVPYALKAGDAATIGGLPPSAFVLAGPQSVTATAYTTDSATGQSVESATSSDVTTSGGTVNYLPLWDAASDITSSVVFQSGTGSTAKIGVGTNTPASTLDIKGGSTVRGTLSLPANGTATASRGADSQPMIFAASAFSSSTSTAVNQTFRWQAEPAGNDTSTPSGTLNLLFGEGTSAPEETGLHIASDGQITFATGQTFPGTGTITGITTATGSGLTGGATSGTAALSLLTTCTANQVLQWSGSAWVCATVSGSGGSGTVTSVATGLGLLGGPITTSGALTINTAVVPQLNVANTFTGNQTVNGNLSATGVVTGSSYQIGSSLFAFGSYANENAFLGFAGNSTMTGTGNTAAGSSSLLADTTGYSNSAFGLDALSANTTGLLNTAAGAGGLGSNTSGGENVAVGVDALYSNSTGSFNVGVGYYAGYGTDNQTTTGSNNTFVGFSTNPGTQTGLTNVTAIGASAQVTASNATAIGANAQVTASNSLVLGSINGINNATASTNVGIGTTAPAYALDVYGTGHFTQAVTFGSPVNFASGQTFPGSGTITGVTANTGLTGGGTSGTVSLALASNACASGNALTALPFTCAAFATTGANAFTASQSIQGSLSATGAVTGASVTATGVVSGSGYEIGGMLFDYAPGTDNVFLGFAGNPSTTGEFNTAVGVNAFFSNTTGTENTAIGLDALFFNNTGGFNTASGAGALSSNTTGSNNTASGYDALQSNTTGSNNAASGYQALVYNSTGGSNTASGYGALYSNTTGTNNTAVGNLALYFNTGSSADYNTAIGNVALYSNAGGFWNTATGAAALNANTTGSANTADGLNALLDNTTGGNNTAVGYSALSANTTGSDLTCVGASCSVADDGLRNATAIGAHAMVTVSDAVVLGSLAGVNGATATTKVGIGTASPTNLLTLGQGAGPSIADGWTTYSSRRWKTNIRVLPDALGKVEQLRGVSYDLKDSGKHEIGVIAEEVGKVIPEVVTYEDNGKDARGVDYSRLTALLIEAVKQQQRQIRAQQSQIAGLTGKVSVLETALRGAGQAEKSLATVRSSAVESEAAVLISPKNK